MIHVLLAALIAPPAPTDIYFAALSAMRAIQEPAFLKYTDTARLRHRSKERVIVSLATERTRDHLSRYVGTHPDGTPTTDVHVSVAVFPPDLFLNALSSTPGPDEFRVGTDETAEIKTIATVRASSRYSIALVATESRDWCATAYHLALQPKGDPLLDNLRDLWVDSETHRICAATAMRSIYVGSKVDALMSFDLRSDGYVSKYSMVATGRMYGLPYTLADEDTMTDPIPTSDAGVLEHQ